MRGSFCDDRLLVLELGVQHAQRIRFDAPLAVRSQLIAHFLQFRAQFFDVCRAAIFVADRIDVEHRALQLQPLEKRISISITSASIPGASEEPSTSAPI